MFLSNLSRGGHSGEEDELCEAVKQNIVAPKIHFLLFDWTLWFKVLLLLLQK